MPKWSWVPLQICEVCCSTICLDVAKIEADKELTLKNMELKAQSQASTSAAVDPPPRNRDAKSRSYQPS